MRPDTLAGVLTTRRPLLARAVAVVGLVAVGSLVACSSDGPDLSSWAAEATAICADHQREADALGPAVAGPALSDALVAAAEISRDEVEALSELPAPSERAGDVRAWLEALGRRTTALEAYAGALEQAEPGASVAVPESLAEATQDAADLAVALGLEGCGAGVDTPVGTTTTVGPVAGGPAPQQVVPDEGAPPATDDRGVSPDATITEDQLG